MPLQTLTLVLGSAASGKSGFAEGLVKGSGLRPVYVATAQIWDDEMAAKVARHRVMREGGGWRTVEEPLDMGRALAGVTADEAVLVDCATLWLTNVMLAEPLPDEEGIARAEAGLFAAFYACAAPVVIVSNEVGAGIVPDNALARRFRNAQGGLNQRMAARAGLVVVVMAGLPLVLKGSLP
ncbi:MAG: bifunctional adenosylcobinamide kinase/adenosylcobinamide-phosphate guanylyltransferase [Rhodobacterales bacterium]|nr:bifunctional adenosylcobinamide kinase/adenosylcobinamide-phosphate guanylyltransferase [Rhodobacterales bacterium]